MDASGNVVSAVGRIGLNEGGSYMQHKRRLMLGFGVNIMSVTFVRTITEIILGSSCIFCGIASAAIPFQSLAVTRNYPQSLGEGIWCGLWIVISGSLGVACGRATATDCLVRAHMALAIIAIHFAGLLFSLGMVWGLSQLGFAANSAAELAGACIGFVAMVMCIVSASAACCYLHSKGQCDCCNCCCDCCCESSVQDEEQIVYVVQNPPNTLNTGQVSLFQAHTVPQSFQTPATQQPQLPQAMAHNYPQTAWKSQHPNNPNSVQGIYHSQEPHVDGLSGQQTNSSASDQHRFNPLQATTPASIYEEVNDARRSNVNPNYINAGPWNQP